MTVWPAWMLGVLLAAGLAAPARAAGVGERLTACWPASLPIPAGQAAPRSGPAHTRAAVSGVAAYMPPDTSRRAAPDTLAPRPALVPDITPVIDEDKPTRKTALFTALAIAVLTISTLLLYNVRSR